MRARKVAIMLGLIAVSALTLFVVAITDGAALGAEAPQTGAMDAVPDTLDFYRELLSIGPDGNAFVEVSAVLNRGGSGDLLLPFAFSDSKDFTILSGPVQFRRDAVGVPVPTRQFLGHRMLNLELLGSSAAGDTILVGATVPGWFDAEAAAREYGEFAVGRSFVNSSRFVFRSFELAVELPEGMLIHSVTRVVPAYDPKKSPQPPFEIGQREGRGWASLRRDLLAPSGTALLDINIRPARRGLVPLVAGMIAVLLYLVFFRDVLKPKKAE